MKFVSVQEAADTLSVSRSTIERMVDCGKLAAVDVATKKERRCLRIDMSSLKYEEPKASPKSPPKRKPGYKAKYF